MTDDRLTDSQPDDPDASGHGDGHDADHGLPFNLKGSAEGSPAWLSEFEELANRELKGGSSCEQVHPQVARWYEQAHRSGPLKSRDSIQQAMACLSTEVLNTIPDDLYEHLLKVVDEDSLAAWVEYVLYIGRAFERSLERGDFDDL
ncbi:MAG: hypothetical protein NZM00_02105 [Anaerolinea sp.]|nr:hypothetical protein [Anaerolinea sp.]